MRIIAATILAMAVTAGSAHAQVEDKSARQKAEETAIAKERAEIEKEYNATVKRMGAPKNAGKSDPWGTIRPSGGADAKR
jgi:hypothetical protein